MGFKFNGVTYDIPGVYGLQKVIQQAGGSLPDFNIGLIIAKSMKGAPYNAVYKGVKLTPEELMVAYDDGNALKRDYGTDDLYEQFMEAKGQGAGAMFALNANANTQATAILQDGSGDAVAVKVTPKNFGVFGRDITVSIVESASLQRATPTTATPMTGTATAGGATTLTDSAAVWGTTELVGKWVRITSGTGRGQTRKIASHTGTALTVSAWVTNPDTTSTYEIVDAAWTVTVTPTKEEKMVGANIASGANYFYVNNIEGLAPGRTYILASTARETVTIQSIDNTLTANGYKVVITTATANAHTTANYARLFNKAPERANVYSFVGSEWSVENIASTVNLIPDNVIFEALGTDTPVAIAETYMSSITDFAGGVSYPAASADYTEIASLFPDWTDAFETANKVNIRLVLLGTHDASVHAVYKTLETTMRSNQYNRPIRVIVGCNTGDIATTGQSNTNPKYRAFNINNGAFNLCAGGFDGKPAYKTIAAQYFGIKMANWVGHNCTRDLFNVTKVEKLWSRTELAGMLRGGVLTYVAKPTGFRVAQGMATYQDHTNVWNQQDNDTYLDQQKDLADFFHIGYMKSIDALIGEDGVTLSAITNTANAIAQPYLLAGYITSIVIEEIIPDELGWLVKHKITLPGVTDFIGVETYILAGRAAA